jgi:hypothetical protein
MASKKSSEVHSDARRLQHGPVTSKTWPNAVTKAPQPLPGQSGKKSPTDKK